MLVEAEGVVVRIPGLQRLSAVDLADEFSTSQEEYQETFTFT